MTPSPAPLDDRFIADIRRDMLRFAQLQLRDASLAEDAVQEALAAAFAGQQQFAGRAALKTWVFSILRNKVVDLIRQQVRTINLSALSDDDRSLDETIEALFDEGGHWQAESRPNQWGDPQSALHTQHFLQVLDICLNRLPENTARIFMMREMLELESEEICRTLAISSNLVHVTLHRARQGLRRCLESQWLSPGEVPC